jgi:hypothetical protein
LLAWPRILGEECRGERLGVVARKQDQAAPSGVDVIVEVDRGVLIAVQHEGVVREHLQRQLAGAGGAVLFGVVHHQQQACGQLEGLDLIAQA